MTDERHEFTHVSALARSAAPASLSFVTDGQRRVHVDGASALGRIQSEFISTAAAEHEVIFIAFDPSTGGIRIAAPFADDLVRALRPIDGSSDIRVTLVMRPSPMRLKGSHPRHVELRRLLERALSERERVWIGSFPGDQDILDARLAPPR